MEGCGVSLAARQPTTKRPSPRAAGVVRRHPARPSLAAHARPLCHLGERGDAAADAGRPRGRLLSSFFEAVSDHRSAGVGQPRRRALAGGAAWGTTARARNLSPRCEGAARAAPGPESRPQSRPSPPCPASVATPAPQSRRIASASRHHSSTATSGVLSALHRRGPKRRPGSRTGAVEPR